MKINQKNAGIALIILGGLGIVAALLIDIIRTGTLHIQSAQILIIELGLLSIGLGFFVKQSAETETISYRSLIQWINNIPLMLWVFAGFLAAYLAFFITPMFFSLPPRMQYFNKYLPDRFPIGADLWLLRDMTSQWFETGLSPYLNTDVPHYTPFTYAFFSPFLLIDNDIMLYRVVTLLTLACFVICGLLIPFLMSKPQNRMLPAAFFTIGLFSYGMQFELERGQFNVIAFAFLASAIYLYHHHHPFRKFAYVLFSIAVQLKVYPAIFIFMFIKDWRDWKGNLKRFAALGALNFLLLFVMGIRPFVDFINLVIIQLSAPGLSWTGNHSIKAFTAEFVEAGGFGLVSAGTMEFLQNNQGVITNLLLIIFFICLFSALHRAWQHNRPDMDMPLFLIVTIGALIIPVSNDYTLSILPAPAALALTALAHRGYENKKILVAFLLLSASAAYASMLYPFKDKPLALQNAFPYLLILLIAITVLNHISKIQETNEPA